MNVAAAVRAVRPSDAVALAVVVALFAASLAVYDTVPAELVVHYTPPGGVYYGVETLPKRIGLFVVPVFTLLAFAVARLLPAVTGLQKELGLLLPYYEVGVAGLVVLCGTVHAALLLLNLQLVSASNEPD